jgi:hypothetical protein
MNKLNLPDDAFVVVFKLLGRLTTIFKTKNSVTVETIKKK